jgi:ABC-type transport system substrate-binding protein
MFGTALAPLQHRGTRRQALPTTCRARCASTTPSQLPQRVQDIEEAKSLLKKAGREGFSVVLPTSEAEPGFNEACTIFAEQAKAAGVKTTPCYYLNNDRFLDGWIGKG